MLDAFPGRTKPWYGAIEKTPWYTGGILSITGLLYLAASSRVAHLLANTVAFWTRYTWVPTLVMAVFHGPTTLGWFLLPGVLLCCEAYLLWKRGSGVPLTLLSVDKHPGYVMQFIRNGYENLCVFAMGV